MLPTDAFLKATVTVRELHPGQGWIALGGLGPVAEAAETWCSQSLSFMIHSSAAVLCPTRPQKETNCELGGPGRKLEACLG